MYKSELNIRDKRTIEGIIEELQYGFKHSPFVKHKILFSVSKIKFMIKRLEEIGG